MLDIEKDTIIDSLLNELKTTKRKTSGQDKTKKYQKITISIDLVDKTKVIDYAKKHKVSISELIRNLLKENKIL